MCCVVGGDVGWMYCGVCFEFVVFGGFFECCGEFVEYVDFFG